MGAVHVEDAGTMAAMREFPNERAVVRELAEDRQFQVDMRDVERRLLSAERLEDLGRVYTRERLADLFASRTPR
jgi:hypothetical protein